MAFEQVERVGETLRRPWGPWSGSVAALLEHLERSGFRGAPRSLGRDERGRQVLGWVEGESHAGHWPPHARDDRVLARIARLLRELHEHTASFPVDRALPWIAGEAARAPGQVILHGDVSMSNLVWRGAEPVALIDWEFAEPGPAWNDVLHALLCFAPLYSDAVCESYGFERTPDRVARIELFLSEYGRPESFEFPERVSIADVTRDLIALMERDAERIDGLGLRALEPWASLRAAGLVEANRICREWIGSWESEIVVPTAP